MKVKLMPVLAGAVVAALAATPFVVKAVTPSSEQPAVAQAQTQPRRGKFVNLNLTQAQRDQIRQIQEQTRQKIQAVLTPQQLQQYKAAIGDRRRDQQAQDEDMNPSSQRSRGGRYNGLASLNLTQDQKNQIRQIRRTSREQINGVLTDAQREQIQQNRPSRRNNSDQ